MGLFFPIRDEIPFMFGWAFGMDDMVEGTHLAETAPRLRVQLGTSISADRFWVRNKAGGSIGKNYFSGRPMLANILRLQPLNFGGERRGIPRAPPLSWCWETSFGWFEVYIMEFKYRGNLTRQD